MTNVMMTLASIIGEDGDEHATTYVYKTEAGDSDSKHCLRDHRRADEMVKLILRGAKNATKGRPPENSHPIMSIGIGVMNTRGKTAQHRLGYLRHDFAPEYNPFVSRMMDSYRRLEAILERATRNAQKEKLKNETGRDEAGGPEVQPGEEKAEPESGDAREAAPPGGGDAGGEGDEAGGRDA